jgi:hypothetical protein
MTTKRRVQTFVRWTADDIATAARLYRELIARPGMNRRQVHATIGAALVPPRTGPAVLCRRRNYGPTFDGDVAGPARALKPRAPQDAPAQPSVARNAWSAADIATAARMWREQVTVPMAAGEAVHKGEVCVRIAQALGRSTTAVVGRQWDYGDSFAMLNGYRQKAVTGQARLDAECAAARDALAAARSRQSVFAAMLGDPPPGYSALDQAGRHDRSPH